MDWIILKISLKWLRRLETAFGPPESVVHLVKNQQFVANIWECPLCKKKNGPAKERTVNSKIKLKFDKAKTEKKFKWM